MPNRIYDRRNLADAATHLASDIRNGLFTPFLGAGASSLRPKQIDIETSPWKEVAATLAAIRVQLDDSRGVAFLQSFARQRLGLPKATLDLYLPDDEDHLPEVPRDLVENGLVNLQTQLVEATIRLTLYFGGQFAKEAPSVTNLQDCNVPIDTEEIEGKNAIDYLFRAAKVALDLYEARRNDPGSAESPYLREVPGANRTVSIQRIYEKLIMLIRLLVGENEKKHEEMFAPHQSYIAAHHFAATEKSQAGLLRLDAIQWMSELLWYTLRYWMPRYPTSAELAFELSLKVQYTPVRRGELAQAAQAYENIDRGQLAAEVKDLLWYCEEVNFGVDARDSDSAGFYHAIAAAMCYQFASYSPSEDPLEAYRRGSDGRCRAFPIAFTTNFDRALEKFFEKAQVTYHVVFPVIVGAGGVSKEKIVWHFRTWYSATDGKGSFDRPWSDILVGESNIPDFTKWRGPLIVKLHGSPAEVKPEYAQDHWLVVSEVNYLQAMGEDHRMPSWLSAQLNDCFGPDPRNPKYGRSLWFLGYSMADWNVRLGLWEHCALAAGHRSSVDWEEDAYRCAILGNLDITHYCGDLLELPRLIASALDNENLTKYSTVGKLVSKLTRHLGGVR